MAKRILVVDDEAVVLSSVRKALRKDGYVIDAAQRASTALELVRVFNYDVVITDLMMPGMDGLELLQRLAEMGSSAQAVMITGYPTVRTALHAKRAGAFEYLPKPFAREELRSVVVRALRAKECLANPTEREREPPIDPSAGAPGPVYAIPRHSWAGFLEDGTVRVGMTRALAATIGDVSDLRLPGAGEMLEQGRMCVVIRAADGVEHSLYSPMSGRVVELNDVLDEDAGLAGKDPEREGWMLRLEPRSPDKEIPNLVPA